MMTTENPVAYCIECKDPIECCFCSCPYCGETMENCHCNPTHSGNHDKVLPIANYSKLDLLEHSGKLTFVNAKDNDEWRLEKWQIGRSKFP